MIDKTTEQQPDQTDTLGSLVATLELELSERQRQIDLLKITLERHRQESKSAQARSAMLQAALDRHLEHCGKDEGATQRLIAELAEATARRKEQVAIIERRDRRIVELQDQVKQMRTPDSPVGRMNGSPHAAHRLLPRLKKMFSMRRV